jgi:tRNA A37 N6-isopentenylltransferase MiaA
MERNDVQWYDMDEKRLLLLGGTIGFTDAVIEPYWRYPETRQIRRARERWERKHK